MNYKTMSDSDLHVEHTRLDYAVGMQDEFNDDPMYLEQCDQLEAVEAEIAHRAQ